MKDLRLTFDEDPEVYERVRPSYPGPLFDDLWHYAGPSGAPRICEVGPGTGKATATLLQRGAHVTAVEIGAALGTFLGRKFPGESRLQIVAAPFETAHLPSRSFDIVLAATAWHWLDPAARLERAASLLVANGVLAIIDTIQVDSDTDRGYFAASQAIYRKYGQEDFKPLPGSNDVLPAAVEELEASPRFEPPVVFRYRHDQTYSRDKYQDLMRSYSSMRAMGLEDRERLISELGTLIDDQYGGTVTRPLAITLTVARKAHRLNP